MFRKAKKTLLTLLAVLLVVFTLSLQPIAVHADGDPVGKPTQQGNPPETCSAGC
ncbi:MAG TPA: hypothetical protein VJG32_08145 [Anaerolineae bacterium]|nr:hypothetical protein [Anaerolineae bacterium]